MKTVHICETCNKHYSHKQDAVACEAQTPREIDCGVTRDTDKAVENLYERGSRQINIV